MCIVKLNKLAPPWCGWLTNSRLKKGYDYSALKVWWWRWCDIAAAAAATAAAAAAADYDDDDNDDDDDDEAEEEEEEEEEDVNEGEFSFCSDHYNHIMLIRAVNV